MYIPVERLWLFENTVTDPFFLGEKQSVRVTMEDERAIRFLEIQTVFFYFDIIARCGLNYSIGYGGESINAVQDFGNATYDYEITLNMPVDNLDLVQKMIGREYGIVGMKRDLEMFAVFGRFVVENVNIDNEVLQRVSLESKNTLCQLYRVDGLDIKEIINIVDPDLPAGDTGAFDYNLNFTIT